MAVIDFVIGFTLVNSIPHFVVGTWRGRMLSGLGFGPRANIGYGLINFVISIGCFMYTYGLAGLTEQGMYAGGLFIVISYFAVGKFLYERCDGRPELGSE